MDRGFLSSGHSLATQDGLASKPPAPGIPEAEAAAVVVVEGGAPTTTKLTSIMLCGDFIILKVPIFSMFL
jgi:hypothetical protein